MTRYSHPWPLDGHVRVADGPDLSSPIPITYIYARILKIHLNLCTTTKVRIWNRES
jgi:hypothetical protein